MKKILILITLVMFLSIVIIGNELPEMVLVQAGTFQMGNTRDDYSEGGSDEKPVQTVNLTYDYYIGKYEVTFNEYDSYCEADEKTKPNDFSWGRGNKPVIFVSWLDAIAYCNWLSEQVGLQVAYDSNGNFLNQKGQVTTDITQVVGYRLPTEAEWEYAARGGHEDIIDGNDKIDYQYAGSNNIDELAWYWDNSNGKTHDVGQKNPNELGLYDKSGNVWEWCHDRYGSYTNSIKTNPIGPDNASTHVGRGGCWIDYDRSCRIANRDYGSPAHSSQGLGLRIARTRE